MLLIDEIDRADEALEAVLLEMLGEYQVSVPEIGTFSAKHPPYVILTSNNTRDLAAALKRRCLHLFLDYPSAERELEIVRSKDTGLPEALAAQLVDVVRGLRELDLRKAPSISETIDWARTLAVLGVDELLGEGALRHGVGGGQVRQGRSQGARRAAAAGRPQRDGARDGARSRPRARPRARRMTTTTSRRPRTTPTPSEDARPTAGRCGAAKDSPGRFADGDPLEPADAARSSRRRCPPNAAAQLGAGLLASALG